MSVTSTRGLVAMARLASAGSRALWVPTLLLALSLAGAASAGWGNESWGEMVWGRALIPVPSISTEGVIALAILLVFVSGAMLARQRRGRGPSLDVPESIAADPSGGEEVEMGERDLRELQAEIERLKAEAAEPRRGAAVGWRRRWAGLRWSPRARLVPVAAVLVAATASHAAVPYTFANGTVNGLGN